MNNLFSKISFPVFLNLPTIEYINLRKKILAHKDKGFDFGVAVRDYRYLELNTDQGDFVAEYDVAPNLYDYVTQHIVGAQLILDHKEHIVLYLTVLPKVTVSNEDVASFLEDEFVVFGDTKVGLNLVKLPHLGYV